MDRALLALCALILVAVTLLVSLVERTENRSIHECEARGGIYHRLRGDNLCLRKDALIEVR